MTGAYISLTETTILTVLGTFLQGILPSGIEIIVGQVNRVPEPVSEDFVIMTPVRRTRIETNIDTWIDAVFVGSIAANILTVTSVQNGVLAIGAPVYAAYVQPPLIAGTIITGMASGTTGGVGAYTLSQPQTFASGPLLAGTYSAMQPLRLDVQCDVHGPNSAQNATVMSTLLRDGYGYDQFLAIRPQGDIEPLHADDPKQVPFINGEAQYEYRWIVEVMLQCNPVTTVRQQFADEVKVETISVEAAYGG